MANRFFQPGEQRGAKVADLFAKIAPRYDLINDLQSFGLHRYWKKRLLDLAKVKPGERVLDVCCGTGDLSFGMAKSGADVTGLDFSEPMLAEARSRSQESGVRNQNPKFIEGDAQRLPFDDASFDVVTVGYGLRNLPSWERGLEEMQRVAKPGARILVLDFGKPDNALWRNIYFSYLRWFVPLFGKLFCGDSATHAYILESLKNYPAQRGVAAKMQQLSLKNSRVVNFLGGVMSINYGEK
ncbi:MAG: bifunctional demethylmenaquinone methyltransferase/2-methoxy-6-polyprenyl-1,4-benzoquinol methylase UbiE [Verrucomicrobiota bacterium]